MDMGLLFILSVFSVAAFSIQLAYMSELSDSIKKLCGFILPYPLLPLLYIKSWRKIIGNKFVSGSLFPFIVLFIIVLRLHHLITKIVNCPYCFGFWLQLVVNITVLELQLPIALVLAPLSTFGVVIIEKLID